MVISKARSRHRFMRFYNEVAIISGFVHTSLQIIFQVLIRQ